MGFPIVLVHGVWRFDAILDHVLMVDNTNDRRLDLLHYFKGIRTMLRDARFDAHHATLPFAGNVDVRGDELRRDIVRILAASGASKVNLIAHSAGGLDARHMMFNDRNHGKIHQTVASLTTIGTPHHGSSLADWALRNTFLGRPLLRSLGIDFQSLTDLTIDACAFFNQNPEVIKFERRCESNLGLRFRTYAGSQSFVGVFTVLKPGHMIIARHEGENDGLVSVTSATWKPRFFRHKIQNADHLNELGWWDPSQITAGETSKKLLHRMHRFYAKLAAELP